MKILIIDTSPASRNLAGDVLRKQGYELIFASDGNEAWDLISRRKDIRIVIAEWFMPGFGGIELCKKIRYADFPYYVYFILVVSRKEKSDMILGLHEGADDILSKPFNPDELYIKIRFAERIISLEEDLFENKLKLQAANEILDGNLISGREAQKSLLPTGFPDIAGMEFAANFVSSAYGSGDIYNIFRLDEKNIGLYNIDVSGHGVSAALFSVCLKQLLDQDPQSYGLVKIPRPEVPYYYINSPDEVVIQLDKEDMLGKYGRFFTMVYVVMNVETGILSFYRAGHNFPLVIHDHQHSEFIQGGGAPIGLGIELRREESQEIRLLPGDQFILFSDGINDAYSLKSKSRYGLSRARHVLTSHYASPMDKSFKVLITDVEDFLGEDGFSDDISIIGFKWNGDSTSRHNFLP